MSARIVRNPSPRMLIAARNRDALAAHIADGGTFADFRRTWGLTERGVQKMWAKVCASVGEPVTPDTAWTAPAGYGSLNSKMRKQGFSLEERQRIIAADQAKKAAA